MSPRSIPYPALPNVVQVASQLSVKRFRRFGELFHVSKVCLYRPKDQAGRDVCEGKGVWKGLPERAAVGSGEVASDRNLLQYIFS